MIFLSLFFSSIFIFHHVSSVPKRILGGIGVESSELNYTVAITQNGRFICGGSIIGDKYILTAAHCLINETDKFRKGHFQVIAGSTDLKIDQPSKTVVNVEAIYAPIIYNGTFWQTRFPEGDIAVLKLSKGLPLSGDERFKKLKLPKESRVDEPYIFEIALVSGYGLDKVETDIKDNQVLVTNASTSLKMYKANSIVFDHVECSNHYETMYDSNLCGKVVNYKDDTPQGVCEGDSGGPLVYNEEVIGVVSGSAPACNENEYPSVFTKVASYSTFIRNVLRGKQLHMRVKTGLAGFF